MAACFTTAAQSAVVSWNISAKQCSATTSTIRCSISAISLTHEGPALKAQKEAAQIFGAEKTYFVLNGTSTSNKVVLGALVTDGDLVLFDRNNHKAAHHGALMMAGGIPSIFRRYETPGLIGPMHDALDETALRERIRNHPLVKDPEAWRKRGRSASPSSSSAPMTAPFTAPR